MELTIEQKLRIKAMELALQKFDAPHSDRILDFAEKIYQFLIKQQ